MHCCPLVFACDELPVVPAFWVINVWDPSGADPGFWKRGEVDRLAVVRGRSPSPARGGGGGMPPRKL